MGSLDNLATNGIIDFDAEAYVKGLPPRFIGRPERYVGLPGEMPLMAEPPTYGVYPGAHLSGHPRKDGFENHEGEEDRNPGWKKALMTVLLSGLAIIGAVRYRGKIAEIFNKKKAAVTSPSFKQKVSDFFSNAKTKVVEFFKGPSKPTKTPTTPATPPTPAAPVTPPTPPTPPSGGHVNPPAGTTPSPGTASASQATAQAPAQAPAQTPANATKPAKKSTWASIPNWAKYTGIGLATTLGLYSIYKALSSGREEASHE